MLSMQKGNTRYSLCCSDVPAIIEDKFEGKKYYFSTQIRTAVLKQNNFKKRFSWFA